MSAVRAYADGMAIHPRVAINTMGSPETRLDDDCGWIRDLGAAWVTVAPGKLDAMGWDAGIDAVVSSGLAVASVVCPAMFQLDSPETWPAVQQLGIRTIEAAAAMRAACVYGVTGGPGRLSWEDAADAYGNAVAPMLECSRWLGVPLAIEPTIALRISINLCHSLRDVVTLAERVGVSVCIDFYGCFAEAGLADTIARAAPMTVFVQVSDYVYGTLDTPNRAVPGDGDLAIERMLRWILDAGYAGPFDLELNGPRIDAEGYRLASGRGALALTAMLERLGA
jgi:sugar phosphate isomerase/epimerase